MKNVVRGLWALVGGLALSIFVFGQFSAMEQGPPGTVFQQELTKTYPADPVFTTLVVAVSGAVGAIVLFGGRLAGRLRSILHLLVLMNTFLSNLGRYVLGYLRKLVPVPQYKTSRLSTVI